jgi:hypothetical protein
MPANRPARSHSQPQLSRESRKNPHKKFLASPSDLNLTLTEIVYPACNTRELTFEPRPPTFCHKEHSPGLKTSCPRGASGVPSQFVPGLVSDRQDQTASHIKSLSQPRSLGADAKTSGKAGKPGAQGRSLGMARPTSRSGAGYVIGTISAPSGSRWTQHAAYGAWRGSGKMAQ